MKKTLLNSLFLAAIAITSFAGSKNIDKQEAPKIQAPANRMINQFYVDDGGGGGGSSIPNYYGFNRKQFLENSYMYEPWNRIGTCGYISLMQLLSFYDTFYNDNIIPDQYDRSNQSATTLSDAVKYSPGVEPISSSEYPCGGGEYYSPSLYRAFCYDRQSFCFQSYLNILDNQARDIDDNTNFDHSNQFKHYQKILDRLYGEGKAVVNVFDSSDQNVLKQKIKAFIDGGDPVLVSIVDNRDPDDEKWTYHAVVAYDYSGDTIYANFGRGAKNKTHVDLLNSGEGYRAIRNIATLNFNKMGPKHSDNYVINGVHYCGCCGYRTDYLNNTQDHLAANLTGSTKKVTWASPLNGGAEFVDLHVVNSSGYEIFKVEHLTSNEYTFSSYEWNQVVFYAGSRVGFYVVAHADPIKLLWMTLGYRTNKGSITFYTNVSETPSYEYSYSFSSSNTTQLSISGQYSCTAYKFTMNRAMTGRFSSISGSTVIHIVNANTGRVCLGIPFSGGSSRVFSYRFAAGTYYARIYSTTGPRISLSLS